MSNEKVLRQKRLHDSSAFRHVRSVNLVLFGANGDSKIGDKKINDALYTSLRVEIGVSYNRIIIQTNQCVVWIILSLTDAL